MVFVNVEQIKEKFIKNGWSSNTSFKELTLKDAEEKGYLFAISEIKKGKKYFKMNGNGNIYNDRGEITLYNITPRE
jgi:hypothetical protein